MIIYIKKMILEDNEILNKVQQDLKDSLAKSISKEKELNNIDLSSILDHEKKS